MIKFADNSWAGLLLTGGVLVVLGIQFHTGYGNFPWAVVVWIIASIFLSSGIFALVWSSLAIRRRGRVAASVVQGPASSYDRLAEKAGRTQEAGVGGNAEFQAEGWETI